MSLKTVKGGILTINCVLGEETTEEGVYDCFYDTNVLKELYKSYILECEQPKLINLLIDVDGIKYSIPCSISQDKIDKVLFLLGVGMIHNQPKWINLELNNEIMNVTTPIYEFNLGVYTI